MACKTYLPDGLTRAQWRDLIAEVVLIEVTALLHALEQETHLHHLLPSTLAHCTRLRELVGQWART